MSESQIKAPELEQTSEQQSVKSLVQELHLPDEVIWSIEKLSQDNKEILTVLLQEIQWDLKNGKIVSPADATDKAKNTLTEYGINIQWGMIKKESKNILLKEQEEINNFDQELSRLSESLTKVKSLDPVVEDELKKAKEEKPNLPPELTKVIADKTGINIQSLEDITTKWWEKQQDINNMIDAYYLANIDTARITELLKWKKSEEEINESFATLRNSARHLDIPVYETARNISKLIPDLTDKKQGQVIDTVTSLTASKPDTIVTRTGDTLRFTDPKNEKYSYEIDLGREPPRLAKSLNGLSISHELTPLTQEQREKQNLETRKLNLIKVVSKDSQNISLANITEIVPDTIEPIELVKSYEWAQSNYKKAWNPIEKLKALKELKSKNQLLESARRSSLTTENMWDKKYEKLEEYLHTELEWLSRLENSLFQYIDTDTKLQKYNPIETRWSTEDFDTFASENLSFLVEEHFDRLWPDANTALYRIIWAINNNREEKNKIYIDKSPLNQLEKKTLRDALAQIGGTPDVLTNGEKLPTLQKKITESLRYPRDNPQSIESLLNKKSAT